MTLRGKIIREGYPKRDGDVEIVLTGEHLRAALRDKVLEEAHEVAEAGDQASITEELGDLFEAMAALAIAYDIPWRAVQKSVAHKRARLGTIKDRYVLLVGDAAHG